MSADDQYLRVLSVFHYVVAGLSALCALVPGAYLAFVLSMLAEGGSDPESGWFVWYTLALMGCIILGILAFAAALSLAGRFLHRRVHYTFCLFMAGIACVFFPLGTLLGIFTIIVLAKQSVRSTFEGEESRAESGGGNEAPTGAMQ